MATMTHALKTRRRPPGVSLLLCLALVLAGCGRDRGKKSAFRLAPGAIPAGAPVAAILYQGLGQRMAPGHGVRVVDNGRVFDVLVEDIAGARSSIHVSMYIWEKGVASDRVTAALVERARAGVGCRILIDAFGSPDFDEDVQPRLAAAGCEVRIFRPPPGSDKLARNHRKIVVVDGRHALTGGFGIRDDWLGDGVQNEAWRDTNVRFAGPAVAEAQRTFAESWLASGGALLPPEAFPAIENSGPSAAAFVASTASPVATRAERLTQLMILAAKRRIWISNAYFVPSEGIVDLLGKRAREGLDVRVLTAGKKSDSKTSFGAQKLEYGKLAEDGVRVWEYQPSMLHSKTMLVDDALALIGSINLEPLSLTKLEDAALVVEDRGLASELERAFLRDLQHAEEKRR